MSEQLRVALIQTELHWESPAQNRQHFEPLLRDIEGADLIVLPEMFSTGFSMASKTHAEPMSGYTVHWLKDMAAELDTNICGSVMIEDEGQFYNRFLLVTPGRVSASYNKRHLFRMADEHHHYRAGQQRITVDIKGVKICPQVCYDLRFPVFSRNGVGDNAYDLLLYVANWPAPRRHHWRTLLTARAIENQCYVVGVNRIGVDGNQVTYAGDSGLISPQGEWLADLTNQDTVQTVEIDLKALEDYRQSFPAWQDADTFSLRPDEH